jgi:predicted metal-binding protein
MSEKRDYRDAIEAFIYDYPVCEFFYLTPDDLVFSDKVRYICENECTRYGKCWACPPAVEPIEKCIEKCRGYKHVFLFSTVGEVSDSLNMSACVAAKRNHEEVTLALRGRFREAFGDNVLALSTGCALCEQCAYPTEPCRHPDRRLSTVESHGILLLGTVQKVGATYECTSETVVFFSLIFFND